MIRIAVITYVVLLCFLLDSGATDPKSEARNSLLQRVSARLNLREDERNSLTIPLTIPLTITVVDGSVSVVGKTITRREARAVFDAILDTDGVNGVKTSFRFVPGTTDDRAKTSLEPAVRRRRIDFRNQP